MIYIVAIFMVTMKVGSWFPNMTNKVREKNYVDLVFHMKYLYAYVDINTNIT